MTEQLALHSLLVPLDLTPGSDRVLARLAQLPLAKDAELTLFHVVPPDFSAHEQRSAVRDAEKTLVEEARHLRKQLPAKVSVECDVKVGSAAKEIALAAARSGAELIVMGRGGGNAVKDSILGSTAERVVRQAKLPVLVVRLPARSPYRRPALALELDHHAHEVVRTMLRVLPPPRPRIDVVHAFDVPYQGLIYPSLPVHQSEARIDETRARATHELEALLAESLSKARVPGEQAPAWKAHVGYGSARAIVEKTTKRAESDLLVLGTRGRSGAAFVFLGTVAGELLRAARCDVLVVPPARAR